MLPIVLFRSGPQSRRVAQADLLAQMCDKSYYRHFGRDNVLPSRSKRVAPVCCVGIESMFWVLQCNDPELTEEQLAPIVAEQRAWENAPAFFAC